MGLDAAISDWRIINADPRFHAWLQGIDSFNGISRQQLLDNATARGDASRVIRFFRDFLQQAGGQAPGRSMAAAGSKPIYTRAQIARLYDQHRRGAYKGRSGRADRLCQAAAAPKQKRAGGQEPARL
jgi:hypothetical protein